MVEKFKQILEQILLFPICNFKRRIRGIFWDFRVRLRIKRAGFHVLFKIKPFKTYSLAKLATFDSLPQGEFPHNHSLDTLKVFDAMVINKIHSLQFGNVSEETKFLTMNLPDLGFGVALPGFLSRGLICSYLSGRRLLVNGSGLVYDFCYEPISSTSSKEFSEQYAGESPTDFLLQEPKIISWNDDEIRSIFHRIDFSHPLQLPFPQMYMRGLVLGGGGGGGGLKLKQEYKAHLEEKRKEIGFKNPVIGIHIRQGDVWTNPFASDRRIHYSSLLEVVEQIADKAGIKTVFVTTDSEEVIQQLPKNSGIDFIYDDKEKRYNIGYDEMLKQHPELRKQETLVAVKNIYLLAECDYIISARGSWFWNAVSLSYFRNKKLNGIELRKKGQNIDLRFHLWEAVQSDPLAESVNEL